LKRIVRSLQLPSTEDIDRQAISALYHLVLDNDKRKHKICAYHVVDHLNDYLSRNPAQFSGLKDISIQLIHQLTANEYSIKFLIEGGVIFTLLEMLNQTYGNLELQKTCIFSMVRIISTMDDEGIFFVTHACIGVLKKLAEMGIINIVSGCLRRTHHELTCWAIWFLNQFVIRSNHTFIRFTS
jgi:hypothetical protein